MFSSVPSVPSFLPLPSLPSVFWASIFPPPASCPSNAAKVLGECYYPSQLGKTIFAATRHVTLALSTPEMSLQRFVVISVASTAISVSRLSSGIWCSSYFAVRYAWSNQRSRVFFTVVSNISCPIFFRYCFIILILLYKYQTD